MDRSSPQFIYVLDKAGNRKAQFPMRRGGGYGLEIGPNGLYLCQKDETTGETTSVRSMDSNGHEVTRFKAPDGRIMLGWTPNGGHLMLAPTDISTVHPWHSMIWRAGRGLQVEVKIDYSSESPDPTTSGQVTALADSLPVLVWDRPDAKQSVRVLSYFDFAEGRRTVLPMQIDSPYERITASVAPGLEAFLLAFRARTPEAVHSTVKLGEIVKWKQTRLFLVHPKTGQVKVMPLSPAGFAGPYVLMEDGTILAIEGDSLLRYDPRTNKKHVIVEDLFETWKQLGEERPKSQSTAAP